MKIELNHNIVPALDKEKSARFYEKSFGFKYEGPLGHFAPVRIPSQSLSVLDDGSVPVARGDCWNSMASAEIFAP